MSNHQSHLDDLDRLAAFMQEVIDDIKIRGMSPEDAGAKLQSYFAPPVPSGEGEAHTIENIMAKRATIGYDTRFDSSATLYCDECSAGANTVEMHGKDGCTGTFRAPEPCGTCGGTKVQSHPTARSWETPADARDWRNVPEYRGWCRICPDCATSEGDAT